MANDKTFKIKNGLSAKRYLQSSTAVAASDVDMSSGSYFTKTLSANTTFTFSNPPASGTAGSFALEITGADVTVGYDLANASYDSVASPSLASQEGQPRGLFFKSDGTKMYITGSTASVYQYTLSPAWDVTTASYDSVSFSVSSQEAGTEALFFKSDGTKMYILGINSDAVFQYSLSTAWDLSTASYDSVSFSVSSQEANSTALFFKSDGTKMYSAGVSSDTVAEYNLSTAWDISSASYSQGFSISTQHPQVGGIEFSDDGTSMFVVGFNSDTVSQYSLSTAWDISTASYDSVNLSISAQDTVPNAIRFKDDGTKMFIAGVTNDKVYQYSTTGSAPATITYPSSVKWSGATTPDAPAAGEKDVYTFVTTDGGTTYYGKQAGDAVA